MRAARDPPGPQSARGALVGGGRLAALPPPHRRLSGAFDRHTAMARTAFAAVPLLAWTTLLLAGPVDACPSSQSMPVRSCTSRNDCTANMSSIFIVAHGAIVSTSCVWIVRMADDVYVTDTQVPFNMTATGGCSRFLQMGSGDASSLQAGSSACQSSRLKTGYLFFRSGSSVVIQPTASMLELLNQKHPFVARLFFRAGSAVSLCEVAELEINRTTFVRTPFLANRTMPCVTTLKVGAGQLLSLTMVDIWPNPAPSSCACYERLTAEPRKVICWSEHADTTVVDRVVNVSLSAAGEGCTVVLFAQVLELPTEFITTVETQSVPSEPGVHQFLGHNLIMVISGTAGGGIVIIICVAAALVIYQKRCVSRLRKVSLHHRLMPQGPNERTQHVTEEPLYYELDNSGLTYCGHLSRPQPLADPNDDTAVDAQPDVKTNLTTITAAASSRATTNGGSATNDYEEIGPLIGNTSGGR